MSEELQKDAQSAAKTPAEEAAAAAEASPPALMDIGILNPLEAEFFAAPGGFLGLRLRSETYNRVLLRRVLPFRTPGEYISVADGEQKELGILRSVSELADGQASLVLGELERQYYSPEITAIKSIKDKMGYIYIELLLGDTERTVAVKDVSKNIRLFDDDKVVVFDVDGNRFRIKSLEGLDAKSRHRLWPYLF